MRRLIASQERKRNEGGGNTTGLGGNIGPPVGSKRKVRDLDGGNEQLVNKYKVIFTKTDEDAPVDNCIN